MKRLIALIAAMIIVVLPILAQDTTLANAPLDDVTVVITSSGSIESFFLSLVALVPLVTALAAFVNSKLTANGTTKQIIAWILSIAVCFGAWFLKLGMFADLSWYITLAYGFAVGLAANGFFDIKIIQAVLNTLRLSPKKR